MHVYMWSVSFWSKVNNVSKFRQISNAFSSFLSIIEAIAEALCAERARNADRLVVCFQLLILGCETATSVLEIKNTNIWGDGNSSVL
jgi:3-deoxy-D-arabino-heptulosonate 7-phosphate (DAHP) synthase class II